MDYQRPHVQWFGCRQKGCEMKRAVAGALLVGLAVAGGVAAPAAAAPSAPARPMVCDPGNNHNLYSFSGKKKIYIRAKDGRVYGDSGITLSISKGVSKTIGGSVTGTASAEAGVIFAKASASLAISVQGSRTTTTTFSGTWTVPKSQKTGWLEVGTYDGYTFKWSRYHYASPCRKVVDAKGTGKGPTRSASLAFKHS